MLISTKAIVLLICIFIIVPFFLGLLLISLMKDSDNRTSIPLALVMGVFVLFILYYIPAVIFIINKCSLTLLTYVWVGELLVFVCISILRNRKYISELLTSERLEFHKWRSAGWLVKFLTFSFLFMVIFQALALSYANIYDTDDARYIAESLDAISTDRMLLTNPLTGEVISEPVGEMIKDVICPFPMLQASVSKLLGVHPATLCHVILPLFLIPLCYLVYWLLAIRIFGQENREKRMIFLNCVCVLMMFGRMSAYWNSAYLLWRIWQGKAILAAIVIPFLFWLMQEIMRNMESKEYYVLLLITTFGACILSPMSAIFSTIIIGIYTLIIWWYSRRAVIFFRMGLCCIPMALFVVLSKVIGMVRYGL